MAILLIYAGFITCLWLYTSIYLVLGRKKIGILLQESESENPFPSVAIIVPVRNEAEQLTDAITSLCGQRYPSFRVIVINDRSTDNSGYLLRELVKQYSNLTVIDIHDLPD